MTWDFFKRLRDLTKMKTHYPGWGITKTLKQTVAEIAASWSARLPGPH